MFKRRQSLTNLTTGIKTALFSTTNSSPNVPLDKVLVVSKLSRYEFERIKHNFANDEQLERELKSRGTDFDRLLHFHNLHKQFEEHVVSTIRTMGVNVDVVNRFDFTEERVNWADIIMPTGGDGTFLLAASKVHTNTKPVIGLNSDPNRSEGHLCLPKRFSNDVCGAIERLQNGRFSWLQRSRIRLKLAKQEGIAHMVPQYLHEAGLPQSKITTEGLLPVLALNEVFVGETFSARVSHLQMKLNSDDDRTNIKCSGMCICTGTGSTSWHLSINRLPIQSVAELLRLCDIKLDAEDEDTFARRLTDKYNRNLTFNADDDRMGYTIRDLISARVWPHPKGIKSRGLAKRIELKSNCFDGSLVIDGGVSFPFNDGTEVVLEIKPEDSLRTVILAN